MGKPGGGVGGEVEARELTGSCEFRSYADSL